MSGIFRSIEKRNNRFHHRFDVLPGAVQYDRLIVNQFSVLMWRERRNILSENLTTTVKMHQNQVHESEWNKRRGMYWRKSDEGAIM